MGQIASKDAHTRRPDNTVCRTPFDPSAAMPTPKKEQKQKQKKHEIRGQHKWGRSNEIAARRKAHKMCRSVSCGRCGYTHTRTPTRLPLALGGGFLLLLLLFPAEKANAVMALDPAPTWYLSRHPWWMVEEWLAFLRAMESLMHCGFFLRRLLLPLPFVAGKRTRVCPSWGRVHHSPARLGRPSPPATHPHYHPHHHHHQRQKAKEQTCDDAKSKRRSNVSYGPARGQFLRRWRTTRAACPPLAARAAGWWW